MPFSAWLFRIAANLAADRQQATGREAELTDETEILPVSWNEELAQAERRANLFTLVDRLPKDQRQVIVLRFVEERTGKEIAQAMGKSEGAVKQLQLRALRNLRAWAGETND